MSRLHHAAEQLDEDFLIKLSGLQPYVLLAGVATAATVYEERAGLVVIENNLVS